MFLNTTRKYDGWCIAWSVWIIGWATYDLIVQHWVALAFQTVMLVVMLFVWRFGRRAFLRNEALKRNQDTVSTTRAAWKKGEDW